MIHCVAFGKTHMSGNRDGGVADCSSRPEPYMCPKNPNEFLSKTLSLCCPQTDEASLLCTIINIGRNADILPAPRVPVLHGSCWIGFFQLWRGVGNI